MLVSWLLSSTLVKDMQLLNAPSIMPTQFLSTTADVMSSVVTPNKYRYGFLSLPKYLRLSFTLYCKFSQLVNVLLSIPSILPPITTFVRFVQPSNAKRPIDVTLFGIVMLARLLQSSNAE